MILSLVLPCPFPYRYGLDQDGYTKSGFDKDGLDKNGYDKDGFDKYAKTDMHKLVS